MEKPVFLPPMQQSLDQPQFRFLAKTFQGLEEILAEELHQMGAQKISPRKRAVVFEGDLALLYQANLQCRTALRILLPIHEFSAYNDKQLYKGMQEIDWRQYMRISQTFAIDSVVKSQTFRHSHFVALKGKDALVDQFRKHYNRRPSVDTERPDLRIQLHINQERVRVLLDSSGEALFKRGYRQTGHRAPLNEVLAAGMIMLTGWQGEKAFVDPMCGSGTLPIEAALIASNTAPGLLRRKFGFHQWQNYDPELWQKVRREVRKQNRPVEFPIVGSDRSRKHIRLSLDNADRAGVKEKVYIRQQDFLESKAPAENGLLVLNPPYGERWEQEEIDTFYKQIGDQFKQQYKGFEAWVISSNFGAMKRIGLRASKKLVLFNGPLECKYQRYELY
jgi:putative N6-adenine-specific DNA methylase